MFIKTSFCPTGVNLPYIIHIDDPKFKIGIFGDSFAALAEEANRNKILYEQNDNKRFNHEGTWPYFIANMLKAETHVYGILAASMVDVCNTIINLKTDFDIYFIFHTSPLRVSLFTGEKYSSMYQNRVKKILKNKQVIDLYWDKKHKIQNFGNYKEFVCKYHLTHPNTNEVSGFTNVNKNPNDILGSYHHMSSRGNFLFAFDLYNYLKGEVAIG